MFRGSPVVFDGSPIVLFMRRHLRDAVPARRNGRWHRQLGHIIDPFGHGWTVASHTEDVTPEELMRRMAELFG
jgi:hypothetical protein